MRLTPPYNIIPIFWFLLLVFLHWIDDFLKLIGGIFLLPLSWKTQIFALLFDCFRTNKTSLLASITCAGTCWWRVRYLRIDPILTPTTQNNGTSDCRERCLFRLLLTVNSDWFMNPEIRKMFSTRSGFSDPFFLSLLFCCSLLMQNQWRRKLQRLTSLMDRQARAH